MIGATRPGIVMIDETKADAHHTINRILPSRVRFLGVGTAVIIKLGYEARFLIFEATAGKDRRAMTDQWKYEIKKS